MSSFMSSQQQAHKNGFGYVSTGATRQVLGTDQYRVEEDSITISAPPGSTSIDTGDSTVENMWWLTNDASLELERNATKDSRVLKLKQEAQEKARLKALYMERSLNSNESTDGNQLGIEGQRGGQLGKAEFDELKAKYPVDAKKLKEQEQRYNREAAFEKALAEKAKELGCTVDELRKRLEGIVSAAKNNK